MVLKYLPIQNRLARADRKLYQTVKKYKAKREQARQASTELEKFSSH